MCTYIYIYIYIHRMPDAPPTPHAAAHSPMEIAPDPKPQKFTKLVFLLYFSPSSIFLNWLSVALVGVGGSDFICCTRARSSRSAASRRAALPPRACAVARMPNV